MKRGDVYWVDFEPALGGEMRKRRPSIIVSNDNANRFLNRVQVIPMTTNTARVFPSEALVAIAGQQRKAMADQIRTVAKERLTDYIGSLSQTDMAALERAIRIQLDL